MKHMLDFDAVSRTYEYRILLGRDPFLLDITWQLHSKKSSDRENE